MKIRHSFILFAATLIATLMACQTKQIVKGDILLTNGLLIDGTGANAVALDVVITADTISWIGSSQNTLFEVTEIIDVAGDIIAPGFIDIHAHGDPVNEKVFNNFLAQGVTSICLGMDGGSVAESSVEEWIAALKEEKFGVNIIPFAGHGDARVRAGLMDNRALSNSELKLLISDLKNNLSQGLWGVSMGLEYLPGFYADSTELIAIAKLVDEYDGLITSHIRSEDDDQVDNSILEMGRLSDYCRTNISHLKVVYGREAERADEIISLLDAYDLTADLYPYTASYTGIGIVFPNWAKQPKAYASIKKKRSTELAEYLKTKVTLRGGPEATLFGTAPYTGKTLEDLAKEYNLPFEVVLRDIIGPYGGSAAYFVMNEELQKQLLHSNRVMVSSDGSPTMHHPRGYGSFSKIIEEFVVRDSLLKIEEAIYKMTGQPVQLLKLHNRGTLRVGNKADVIVFNPTHIKAEATFEYPHQPSVGMDYIFVNGLQVDLTRPDAMLSGELLLKL